MPASEEVEALKNRFRALDTDNDGKITIEELNNLVKDNLDFINSNLNGRNVTVEDIIKNLNVDDNKLSYEEFIMCAIDY